MAAQDRGQGTLRHKRVLPGGEKAAEGGVEKREGGAKHRP